VDADQNSDRALVERQEIVVPIAVGVGPQIGRPTYWSHDAHVGSFPGVGVDNKERIGLGIDAGDHLLARPFPARNRIPQMGNVLVRALRVRFGDASDLNVGHVITSFGRRTTACSDPLCGDGEATQTTDGQIFLIFCPKALMGTAY
jgi:hypothetical protein